MPGQRLTQQQRLLQKLSPQQIQMLKLLELPVQLLEERIRSEVEENPVLEIDRDAAADNGSGVEAVDGPDADSGESYPDVEDDPAIGAPDRYASEPGPQRQIQSSRSLTESLLEQIQLRNLDRTSLAVAVHIIGSLDDDGYLRRDFQSIEDDLAFMTGLEVDDAQVAEALSAVQELEPTGIAARDLRECLLLQLAAESDQSDAVRLARRMLEDHYDDFSRLRFDRLSELMSVGRDDLQAAVSAVRSLNPKPGSVFAEDRDDVAGYVQPDFIVDNENGELSLRLAGHSLPPLRINRAYVDRIRRMAQESTGQNDRDAIRYVREKLDSARWFISAVEQRQRTLLDTMTHILALQKDFFLTGDRSKIRPMVLRDIAQRTGLNISTISRVVNSKYVQAPFGILSLKSLFSSSLQTESGEDVSSLAVKTIISECVAAEDPADPLTDQAILDILSQRGYRMARRTVAKYRDSLGIPVARMRRQI